MLPDVRRYRFATGLSLFLLNALMFLDTSAYWHSGNAFLRSSEWQAGAKGIFLAFLVSSALISFFPQGGIRWCALVVPMIFGSVKVASYGGIDNWVNIITTPSGPRSANEFGLLVLQFVLTGLALGAHILLLYAQRKVALDKHYDARERWWSCLGGATLIVHTTRLSDPPDPWWTIWNVLLVGGAASLLYGLWLSRSRKRWLRDVEAGRVPAFALREGADIGAMPHYEFAHEGSASPTRVLVWRRAAGEEAVARVP